MASGTTTSTKDRRATPLWIISLFVGLTEAVLGIAVTQVTGGIQVSLTVFVIAFPLMIAAAFFAVLWNRPWVFYSPGEYGRIDPATFVATLTRAQLGKVTTKTADLSKDVHVVGNPDHFVLLFKAVSGTWKKSTKAMDLGMGCVVQVSTEQLGPDGSISVAEAVTFVPGVTVTDDGVGIGKRLIMSGLSR